MPKPSKPPAYGEQRDQYRYNPNSKSVMDWPRGPVPNNDSFNFIVQNQYGRGRGHPEPTRSNIDFRTPNRFGILSQPLCENKRSTPQKREEHFPLDEFLSSTRQNEELTPTDLTKKLMVQTEPAIAAVGNVTNDDMSHDLFNCIANSSRHRPCRL